MASFQHDHLFQHDRKIVDREVNLNKTKTKLFLDNLKFFLSNYLPQINTVKSILSMFKHILSKTFVQCIKFSKGFTSMKYIKSVKNHMSIETALL